MSYYKEESEYQDSNLPEYYLVNEVKCEMEVKRRLGDNYSDIDVLSAAHQEKINNKIFYNDPFDKIER